MAQFGLLVFCMIFVARGVYYGDPQCFAAGALPAAVLLTGSRKE